MRRYFILVVFCFFYFSAGKTQAQQILFKNYSVLDGLTSNTVWCINQDEKGYMWFGTKNGISRFDGYQFKAYQFNEKNPGSLGNNFVLAITQYDDKTYWIATQGGVYILDLEKERFQKYEDLKNQSIYDILKDRQGNMWIASKSNGIYFYSREKKALQNYKYSAHANSVSANQVRKIVEDSTGKIWIGTFGGGIDVYDPASRTFKNYTTSNSDLSSNFILTLFADKKGNVWAGTFSGGLNVWQKDSNRFKVFKKADGSINDDIVRAIYQPSENRIFIGTEKGLNILRLSDYKFSSITKKPNDPFSLSDNAIYSIFSDREGGIWIGTFFGGVNYCYKNGSGFELYYPTGEQKSLSGNAVSAFLEDKPGMFWVGTEDGGLNYFNSHDKTFKQYPFDSHQEKLSYHNIHALYKDVKGNIWIGTFAGGLNVYNPQTGRVKTYKNIPGDPTSISANNVYSIYEDKDHVIWVGTTFGLNIYDPVKDVFKRVTDMKLNENIIYDIYEDDTKTMWFATYDIGLIAKNKRSGKWTKYQTNGKKGSLSSDKIICLLDDHAGNLWLGTDGGGLNRFNLQDKTFEVYGESAGMDGNVVYGILQDDNRTLWISTNNGLYNFIPGQKRFKQYTNWDNLQSRQFNYNAYYKASSGKLYFGGIKGFNAFYPDSIRDINISNKIAFTNFQLFNKDVNIQDEGSPLEKPLNYTEHITLTHDQSVISIEYAALSFVAPQKTKYAYKMEGFDKEWNYVGTQRKATYTNLPAGDYVFRVKAAGNDGNWNSEGASIHLTVKPPFYRTVWAYMVYIMAAAAAFIYFRRYTINQTRKENAIKLERIKTRKEQEFYSQKIEFFTAMAHEIRTPLSLIIAPLEKLLSSNKWNSDEQKQLSVMDENSNRLLNLVNQLLDFRRIESEFYAIHKEDVDLVSLIHTIYSRFSAMPYQKGVKFTMSTKVSKLIVQIDPEAFTKILNNLLINAFKFTRTKVEMCIDEPEQDSDGLHYFSVSVEDDGIGIPASEIDDIFKKFFKVSSGDHQYSNLGGTGIGLALAKSLAEKHDGSLEVRSTENVNTVFKVRIPYTITEEPIVPFDAEIVENIADEEVERGADEDKTTIMVVEDDLSLNDFISQSLRNDGFQVIKTTNGSEALNLLDEYQVDLIISDVMMPVMDGMELCSAVKTNINYSHIPFILLTARSNSESEIAGIESGADSYIVKPFKWKHVSAVVKNLLESRSKLRNKFAEQPFTKANSLTTNSRDKKFIDKVTEIIEQRITDPQLSVEELSKDLAMSRSSLHKKLKSLSGYVPNEFIRLIRLKKAAELILSQEYNISEISYLVGFNSHSYFSKCFVNQFKMPPSEFLEKHNEKVVN